MLYPSQRPQCSENDACSFRSCLSARLRLPLGHDPFEAKSENTRNPFAAHFWLACSQRCHLRDELLGQMHAWVSPVSALTLASTALCRRYQAIRPSQLLPQNDKRSL